MTQISAVAKNYAKALFGAAKDGNKIDKIAQNLEIFKKNFTKDFANELENPAIARDDCVSIVTQIAQKLQVDELFLNFLKNLAKNRRLAFFSQIFDGFSKLLKEEKNILEIELISASELENSVVEEIKNLIKKQHQGKTIEVKTTLDAKLLGGVCIKIGSNLIDASLKNKLSLIEEELVKAAA